MEKEFVLSIGFPQYVRDKSGMSKVILAHQKMFNEYQISYIHLFAVKKLMLQDRLTIFSYFGMYIDGKYAGIYTAEQVNQKLEQWFLEGHSLLNIHLHHLLYLKLKNIDKVLSALPQTPVKVFLHDYYLCCTNYNLMKNETEFCGGTGFSEKTCHDCTAYQRSKLKEQQLHQLLGKYKERLTFIAPSQVTKEIFLRFHKEYADRTIVIAHQKRIGCYDGNLETVGSGERMKIGFMAMPRVHKGWEVWEKICENYKEDYEFVVFNSSQDSYPGMSKIKVEFSEQNLNAMADAVRNYGTQIVFLWSLCAETYSYTCFEAYSANCYIITNEKSGNIADVVRKEGNGKVFSTEEELFAFLADQEMVRKAVNEYRKKGPKGPEELIENDEIVKLTQREKRTDHVQTAGTQLCNRPLLSLLDRLYRCGKL